MQRALRNPVWIASTAVALAAVLIGVSVLATRGSGSKTSSGGSSLTGITHVREAFAGIPQHGFALGSPAATLTIEEFADIQCPYCAKWATEMLPTVLPYVREGKVRVVFRPLAFVGADSVRGARAVAAASQQGHAWELVDLLYANQGQENSGWASQQLVESAELAVGLDPEMLRPVAAGDTATTLLQAAADEASELNVNSTPTLVFRVKGLAPQPLDPNAAFDRATLSGVIDQALAG